VTIRTKVENNKCIVKIPKKLKTLCGWGCSDEQIVEKMGPKTNRDSCAKGPSQFILARPNDKCTFSCKSDDGSENRLTAESQRCKIRGYFLHLFYFTLNFKISKKLV